MEPTPPPFRDRIQGAFPLLSVILAVAFFAWQLTIMDVVTPNFDEGVYLLQARRVLAGQVPYSDFFYHQTPLYLYVLAAFGALASPSLWSARLLSLIAATVCGIVVAAIARRWLSVPAAIASQIFFYGAPLLRYGVIALPNAPMLLASSSAMLALIRVGGRRGAVVAGICLAIAVLFKPLDIPVVLAAGLWLLIGRDTVRTLPWLVASGTLTALVAAAFFQWLSGGGFAEMLALQIGRYAGNSGFEVMSHYSDFRDALAARGVSTPVGWSFSEHLASLSGSEIRYGNPLLVVAGLAGLMAGFRALPARSGSLLVLWLVLPLAFSLMVWEPAWDHYFMQYVPVLALGGGMLVQAAVTRGRLSGALALALVGGYAALEIVTRPTEPWYYQRTRDIARATHGRYFTFTPVMHAIGETTPACDFIDPQNVYGEYCAAMFDPDGPLTRFRVTADDVLRCIGKDLPVVIDRTAFWFLDARLWSELQARRHPLIFFDHAAKLRFGSGPAPQPPPLSLSRPTPHDRRG
ncbi:MAG TPA: glycosyltransferase family 39 protein [Candidatus Binatia bacterium]|nr:glycosyltransferase family 39 protein [Candidatus Binatia bacterium]